MYRIYAKRKYYIKKHPDYCSCLYRIESVDLNNENMKIETEYINQIECEKLFFEKSFI